MATSRQTFRLAVKGLRCNPLLRSYAPASIGRPRQFSSTPPQLLSKELKELLQQHTEEALRKQEERRQRGEEDYEVSYRNVDQENVNFDEEEEYDELEEGDEEDEVEEEEEEEPDDPQVTAAINKLTRRDRGAADVLKRFERSMKTQDSEDVDDIEELSRWGEDSLMAGEDPDLDREEQVDEVLATRRKPRAPNTFLNYGEDEVVEEEGDEDMEDDDDEYDNFGPTAHMHIEQHREMRHYARLAAWDLPQLSEICKTFEPPSAEECLRFRYTTYMGEHHPAEKKVVLEFCPSDMPDLTPLQLDKLKKLCGVRYNPETDIVKMSSEMFPSQAQNKRYLGDRVDILLKEARDPTDTFADVPLDTRHHHFKRKPKRPAHWKLTPKRKAELQKYREESLQADQERLMTGMLVDGRKQIEAAFLPRSAVYGEEIPEMVMAGQPKPKQILAVKR